MLQTCWYRKAGFCFIHECIIRRVGSKRSLTIAVSAQVLEAVSQDWILEGR